MITLILNMRTHNLTKIFNSVLFLSALFLIALSINKLFLTNTNQNQTLLEIIGEIGSYKNDVRLKRSQDLAWNFVKRNKLPLGINDSVFTNSNSQVDLVLEDQQELKLKSESLIRIKKRDEILLQSGEVEITLKDNAKPLSLNIGNVTYQLKGRGNAKVKITNTQSKKVVQVENGAVEIQKNDQKLEVNSGEKVEFDQAKLSATHANIDLIYPRGTVILKRGERLLPEYQSNLAVKKILLIREDKTFELSPGEDISLRGAQYQYSLEMEKSEIKAPIIDFTLIKEIDAPKPYLPKDLVSYETVNDEYAVNFEFRNSRQKEIQIFDGTQSLIHSQVITGSLYQYKFLAGDNYQWRIRNFEEYTQSQFSEFRKISVHKIDITNLNAVKIELSRPNQLVEFNWENKKSSNVTFRLSRNADFSGDVLEKSVKGDKTKITIPEVGTYFWTVQDKQGAKTPTKIIITPTPAPTRAPKIKNLNFEFELPNKSSSLFEKIINFLIPKAYAQDQSNELKIQVEKIEEAKIYEIEIYDSNKNLVYQKKSALSQFDWSPQKTGQFSYRVRYQDFWRRWSPFSDYAQIQVKAKFIEVVKKKKTQKKKKYQAKKAKKVITKKKMKTESKSKEFKLLSNYYFYSLRSLNATQNGDDEFEIDGLSTTGHGITFVFQSPYEFTDMFVLHYQSQYGVVFDGQDYNQRDLHLGANFTFNHFQLTPYLGLHQHSIYELSGSDAELSSVESTYSLGVRAAYPIIYGKYLTYSPYLKLSALGVNSLAFGISGEYRLKNQFYALLNLASENKIYNSLSEEVKAQSIHILSGIRYDY